MAVVLVAEVALLSMREVMEMAAVVVRPKMRRRSRRWRRRC